MLVEGPRDSRAGTRGRPLDPHAREGKSHVHLPEMLPSRVLGVLNSWISFFCSYLSSQPGPRASTGMCTVRDKDSNIDDDSCDDPL